MPVRAITLTDTYVEIDRGGGTDLLRFNFAGFPPSAGTNEARAQHVIDHAQSWLDTVIKLKDLPADDPDKTPGTNTPHKFWRGTGGNAELVFRTVVIENVSWDETRSPPLYFDLRRIYP